MTLTVVSAVAPGEEGSLMPKWLELLSLNPHRMARVLDTPQARGVATTTTNDTGEVVDLDSVDSSGLPRLLTSTFYLVRLRHWAASTQNIYYQETEQLVRGSQTTGTDPVLVGDARVIHAAGIINGAAVMFGRVKLRSAVASGATTETTDGTTSAGLAIGNFTAGVAALTFPVSRTAIPIGAQYAASTYSATAGSRATINTVNAGAGTASVELASADDGALDTNPSDGTLSLELDITPPVNAFLSVNGTPDPGVVEVHVTGVSSVTYRHYVEVYISEGVHVPLET